MKTISLVLFSVVIFAAASCGGKHTCATYLKNTKEVKTNQERN
jgi:hypothetical protein